MTPNWLKRDRYSCVILAAELLVTYLVEFLVPLFNRVVPARFSGTYKTSFISLSIVPLCPQVKQVQLIDFVES